MRIEERIRIAGSIVCLPKEEYREKRRSEQDWGQAFYACAKQSDTKKNQDI